MRKMIGIILIILCFNSIVLANDNLIFEMNDPVGDEYGPGTYTYPTSEQFKPYRGLFDLTYFKVEDGAKNYNFYFKFIEITNPWHAQYGFSHQLIQLYIDNNSDGGSLKTFKAGANIEFEEKHPWNKLVKITGWSVEICSPEDEKGGDNRVKDARVKLLNDDKMIKVSLPKSKIGDLTEAYYYLLVGSLDGFGHDNYREVVKEAKGWKFGGGTESNLNPNVIDTLVPEGLEQKEVLGSFDLEKGELATLRAVGNEMKLPFKMAIIIGFLVLLLGAIIGGSIKFIARKFNNFD